MAVFLGIDGGGTGCRAAVADAAGLVLGRGSAGPANINSDLATARQNILAASLEALQAAFGPEGAAMLGQARAVLGLAGANVQSCAQELSAALPFAHSLVVTDAVTAVKGALGDDDGIVAALGTGSVYGVQRGGRLRQIGGWGLVLGDEGSGAWLGRALLARALRARDGFVPDTPLLRQALAERGGPDAAVAFAQTARPADFAALAPDLTSSTDPAAQALLARAAQDVAEAVDLLQAGGPLLPVVFLGGLGAHYATLLQGRWPIRPAGGSGLDGALWLARKGAL